MVDTSSLEFIKYSEPSAGVGLVTISRPKALNALNTQVLGELQRVISGIEKSFSLRVVVLTGEGKSFVAGADIGEMSKMCPLEAKEFARLGCAVFSSIEHLPIPVIAAVNGYALGGGCELALAADIRLASEKARFGQPEVGLGIIPGFGGTQRLPRLLGRGIASELLLTARHVKADEALRLGLVNAVYSVDELMPKALEMAQTIAANAPVAVRYTKEAVVNGLNTSEEEGLRIENALFSVCFSTEDQKKGMEAFLNKGKHEYQGK